MRLFYVVLGMVCVWFANAPIYDIYYEVRIQDRDEAFPKEIFFDKNRSPLILVPVERGWKILKDLLAREYTQAFPINLLQHCAESIMAYELSLCKSKKKEHREMMTQVRSLKILFFESLAQPLPDARSARELHQLLVDPEAKILMEEVAKALNIDINPQPAEQPAEQPADVLEEIERPVNEPEEQVVQEEVREEIPIEEIERILNVPLTLPGVQQRQLPLQEPEPVVQDQIPEEPQPVEAAQDQAPEEPAQPVEANDQEAVVAQDLTQTQGDSDNKKGETGSEGSTTAPSSPGARKNSADSIAS